MKVLILNGSPRKGGNTEIALAEMEKIFAAEGIETETVSAAGTFAAVLPAEPVTPRESAFLMTS